MSATAVPYVPRERRYGIGQQTAYGTALGDASTFIELDCGDTEFVPDLKVLETGSGHGSRSKADSAIVTHTKGSLPSITLEGLAKKKELALFLYLFCQQVTEESTAPYKKTFTLHSSQPDFQAGSGCFATVVERDPLAANSIKGGDCVARNLTLTFESGEPLKLTAELVGRGGLTYTSDPSGSWNVSGNQYYYTADIARSQINFGAGSVDFNLESFELACSYEIVNVGQDGNGGSNVVCLASREVTFKMKVAKDADSLTARQNMVANTPINLHIGLGSSVYGSTSADFDIDIHGKLVEVPSAFDSVWCMEFSGQALDNDGGTTAALTVVLADNVDWAF